MSSKTDKEIKKLKEVSEAYSTEVFNKDSIRSDNKEEREVEGLGIAISVFCEWDGVKIMKIFRSALEDSNFHSEAGKVQEMIQLIMNRSRQTK